MSLEELLEFRKQVVENKERLMILNHNYNEMLEKKHSTNANKENVYAKRIKDSKAYQVMNYLRIILPLLIGMLLVMNVIPFAFFVAWIFLFPIVGATFEGIVLPRIVLGKGALKLLRNDNNGFNKEEADELYERVYEAREKYHKSRKEFEAKINNISITDEELYQEYLDAIDGYIEVLESSSPDAKIEPNESIQDNKKLNL